MTKPLDPKEHLDIQAVLGLDSAPASRWAKYRKPLLTAAGLAALALLGAYWMFGGNDSGVTYVTEPVTRGNLTVIVTATGSVQPTKKVDVSSELSGTIRNVLVDYNSPVKAGQLLAELDTTKLSATLNSSRAKLAAAKAKVAEAEVTVQEKERNYARNKALMPDRAISQKDHDQAVAERDRAITSLESARADVTVAEADVQVDETNLRKASIISPTNGVVLTRSIDPGSTVAASLSAPTLFTIAEDLRKMEVRVDVDEADVGQVQDGQMATFSVDAFPNRKFPARIRYTRYSSETTNNVVTYKAILDVDNSELLLRPGMTATAEIKVKEVQDALLIPNAALRYSPPATTAATDNRSLLSRILPGPPRLRTATPREEAGQNRTVWVLRDGTAVAQRIAIGASDGKRTEVLSGDLQAGAAIILDQSTRK
ncbi:efflux RND transporter periplasmic adaptor subunit [Pseudolabrys sp. FHR47]|uniref:efflux RND transporter periplasmic adaptor subunit n=1 Tax=Pseudolabrys sp. FHR47 TaxID=2562284 RepID=UPI0010BEDEDF|nr:efflux RND transporter periplasmic adaptor subunit [Pseudolabrys sp. FHR47]